MRSKPEVRSFNSALAVGLLTALSGLLLSGCGGGAVNKEEMGKIKTAAVLVFTIPAKIEYRENPRETKKSLLQAVAQAAAQGDPNRAATLAHQSFTASLGQKGLPFRVLTVDEVRNNPAYIALNPTSFAKEKGKDTGTMGKMMSFAGIGEDKSEGIGPDGMPQFGLTGWGASPLRGTDNENRYLVAAMKALNVDAAIVVADPGFSWSCYVCIGGTGDGTTGSAFSVAVVNREGKLVLAINQWFGVSGIHAPVVGYTPNPLQHDMLFKGHGEKMAGELVKEMMEVEAIPGKKK